MKQVEIDHFRYFHFPGGLRTGPDGALCFATRQVKPDMDGYDTTLWLYRGGTLTPLTAPGQLLGHWWLDDNTLLLARPGGQKEKDWAAAGLPFTQLQTLPVNGPGEARDFSRLHLEVEDAAPLPDGRVLLLARWNPAAENALAAAGGDPDKAAEALKAESGVEVLTELPFWENGGGFVARRRRRLYVLENGAARPLTDETSEILSLRLSPAGGAAFLLAQPWRVTQPLAQRLLRLDAATLAVTDLGLDGLWLEKLAALDDDTAMVAGSDMKAHGLFQNPDFMKVDAKSGAATTLYSGGEHSGEPSVISDLNMAGEARWYAQGGALYWASTLDESSHLMRMDTETGAIGQVTRRPGAVSEIADAGTGHYIIAQRGLCGPEVYHVGDDGTETRLTRFNAAPEAEYAYARPVPAACISAEGTEIRGFVLKPPHLAEGEKCPAILDIHGGPKAVYGPVLFHEMQFWAGRGFAVICCNPIGGDGRGNAFCDLRGRLGGVDYNDVMAFLDAALARFSFLDPERLAVTGGSYGGFLTNWIIGHTQRFKAAASQRSVSNWGSYHGLSDIGAFFSPDQTGATPWRNPEKLWAQSPLKYAPAATTPTLFIHSDEDYRCPLPEGLQMYSALLEHGTESRMVLFRGESHELSRSGKPNNRVRRLDEITRWFERFLMKED